ncbi:hypothetical protein HY407_00265 [Candidatus Gottesmanbacteria bacterium]|nr:hypothetical protein [Candidatus Gottesmanbacteria bacterium]
MKKLLVLGTVLTFVFFALFNTSSVFAKNAGEDCDPTLTNNCANPDLFCRPKPSPATAIQGTCQSAKVGVTSPEKGFTTLGNAINNILTVAFAVAVLVVLVMLILGAFEWITSGGDKEAVGKARGRIINALIGLAVLAVAFALANVAARFTGLNLFDLTIPAPDRGASGL